MVWFVCIWSQQRVLISGKASDDFILNNATKLANEFASFVTKIELIKEDLNKIHVQEPPLLAVNAVEKLHHFSAVSLKTSPKIIREFTNASSQLDPVPTWLLKSCLDALVPFITEMVNMSLVTGLVPDNWKAALVIPLLRKRCLDLVLKNFRPVSNLPFISLKLWERLHFSNGSTTSTVKVMRHFPNFNTVYVSFTQRKLLYEITEWYFITYGQSGSNTFRAFGV